MSVSSSPPSPRRNGWLLLVQQLPAKPDYLRVKIWRRLQALGAVVLKNAVYVLPATETAQEEFQRLLKEIEQQGGERLLCMPNSLPVCVTIRCETSSTRHAIRISKVWQRICGCFPNPYVSAQRAKNMKRGGSMQFLRNWRPGLLTALTLTTIVSTTGARAQRAPENASPPPLVLDGTIALPDTGGRIDHMAIDVQRKRLFVAELGNGTLDVVDLVNRKVVHRITGLKEPQGIIYEPKSDLVAVASGGDGTLRFFSGLDFQPRGVIALGADADNVRVDPRNARIIVGYGEGALAIIDPLSLKKVTEIPLSAHPESFRLSGDHVFINVPDAGEVVLANLESAKVLRVFKPAKLTSNFPMILDDGGHVAIVFRGQAKLALLDSNSGEALATADTCGDADDLFFDAARKYFYVSCGAGVVDVMAGDGLSRVARIPTKPGARTSLFVPELGQLFVAARVGILGAAASILIFRTAAN